MSLEKLKAKMDECAALLEMHEQTASALSKGQVTLELLVAEGLEETRGEMETAMQQLTERSQVVEQMLRARVGGDSFEESMERLLLQAARIDKIRAMRDDYAKLKVALELELAMGGLPSEQRREAEETLRAMQRKLDLLIEQGTRALSGPRLVTV